MRPLPILGKRYLSTETMADTDKREEASTAPKEEGEAARGESKHPLEHKWTLWYDAGSGGKGGGGSWGSTLRSVYTFDTVEDFWCLYNNIKQPSSLQPGADFHLFKKGIEPKWEDPRCASGGKWTVTVKGDKQVIDQYWLHALLACIGEHFTEGDDICGAVVNIRRAAYRLCIWTRTASDEAIQVAIGKQLKQVLDLNERIGFIPHEDAKHDKSPKDKYTA